MPTNIKLYNNTNTQKNNRGYSLVEILVVVAITAMFTIFSFPGLVRMYNLYNVNGTADQLAADLRLAQQLTITKVKPHYVQIYLNTDTPASPDTPNSYVLYDINTVVVKRVKLGTLGYLIQSSFTNNQIQFQTNGSTTPFNDGRILICQYSTGTASGHYFAVTLRYTTGKVKIFRDADPNANAY